MDALRFIVETLLRLALFVVLLRLLMQWSRTDFRNPIGQAVVKLTNPLIVPLRRILPPMGRLDTASIVGLIVIATLEVAIVSALRGYGPSLNPLVWIRSVVVLIVDTALWTYFYAIFLYALLSFIAPGGYSPMQSLLGSLCEPVLRPIRRWIPSVAGLDLSPLWACIAIQALRILLGM